VCGAKRKRSECSSVGGVLSSVLPAVQPVRSGHVFSAFKGFREFHLVL